MITSSWAAQFTGICARLKEQTDALAVAEKIFEGDDEIERMRPRLNPVSLRDVTHVYQCRANCSRYYLSPHKAEWLEQQFSRASK
jgi:hypothetical protein